MVLCSSAFAHFITLATVGTIFVESLLVSCLDRYHRDNWTRDTRDIFFSLLFPFFTDAIKTYLKSLLSFSQLPHLLKSNFGGSLYFLMVCTHRPAYHRSYAISPTIPCYKIYVHRIALCGPNESWEQTDSSSFIIIKRSIHVVTRETRIKNKSISNFST